MGSVWKKSFSGVNADNDHVPSLLIVGIGDETPFEQCQIRDAVVIRRYAIGLSSSVISAFVGKIVVKARTPISDPRSNKSNILDRTGLSQDCVSVINRKRLAISLVAVIAVHSRCEVKSVDIVCPVVLNDRDDALPHPCQDRRNHDCRHDAYHDAEDCQKAAELVGPDAVERHFQDFCRQ